MKISELIERLKSIQEKEGDLKVCTSQEHEYWGYTLPMKRHIAEMYIKDNYWRGGKIVNINHSLTNIEPDNGNTVAG